MRGCHLCRHCPHTCHTARPCRIRPGWRWWCAEGTCKPRRSCGDGRQPLRRVERHGHVSHRRGPLTVGGRGKDGIHSDGLFHGQPISHSLLSCHPLGHLLCQRRTLHSTEVHSPQDYLSHRSRVDHRLHSRCAWKSKCLERVEVEVSPGIAAFFYMYLLQTYFSGKEDSVQIKFCRSQESSLCNVSVAL